LADFNSDGHLDIWLAIEGSGAHFIQLWLNDGTGQFSLGLTLPSVVGFASPGDLDGDGDIDVLLVVGNQVNIWLNQDDLAIEGLQASNDSPTPLGQTTLFTATVMTGTRVVYTWQFGDGQTAVGAVVGHIYATPGPYTATVTASNSQGQIMTTTQVIIIAPVYWQYMPLIIKP
jgi:uncharacterized membrane protein